MLLNKAIKDKDIQASKIILEYSLGKAKEQIDVTTNGEKISSISPIEWLKNASDSE